MGTWSVRIGSLVPVVALSAAVSAGGSFVIVRSTIDGGGGAMLSDDGRLDIQGTIGQPDAGGMSGGAFELSGGFWFPIPPADCNDDGVVTSSDTAGLSLCLTGPAARATDGCRCFDVDASNTVDLADFALMQAMFTSGP